MNEGFSLGFIMLCHARIPFPAAVRFHGIIVIPDFNIVDKATNLI